MYLMRRFAFIATFLVLYVAALPAQQGPLYAYQDLSHIFYEKQKDSIAENWECPKRFDKRATQAEFKEMWDGRAKYIVDAFEDRAYIHDAAMLAYLDAIVSQLIAGNPSIPIQRPLLLIDRSAYPNAYTPGGNIVAVTLGMYAFANTREELALIIAHELSHNLLNHPDRYLEEKAEWLTSDEYKQSVNDVLNSKYNRYSRLQNIFKEQSFSRGRHSRYHESEADSLAVVLVKGAKIPFDAKVFLRLDSVDDMYKAPLKAPLKQYFAAYGLPVEESWCQKKGRGLSNSNYNFSAGNNIADSLKTHPDCKARYETTVRYTDNNATYTAIPPQLHRQATKMLLWNMFDDKILTTTLYRILLEKDKGDSDVWYDFMIHNVFGELFYKDKKLARFNVVGILPKEQISKSYYELQTMLEQMPKEQLTVYYDGLRNQGFWQSMPNDALALKEVMHRIATASVDYDPTPVLKSYISANGNSFYREYADHFTLKK